MERRRLKSIASAPTAPTTFVQADTNTFRDLVQKLTGLPTTQHKRTISHLVGPTAPPRRTTFKLQERRRAMRNLEMKLHGRHDHHLVDSVPVQSPVNPLLVSSLATGDESPSSSPSSFEEEKAMAEKGFYLHPWPLSTPRESDQPPELLILFPLSSPSQMNRG